MENRTREEIQKALSVLRGVLDTLPNRDAFGESNAKEKKGINGWILALETADSMVENGEYPQRVRGSGEVNAWLFHEFSFINDYMEA